MTRAINRAYAALGGLVDVDLGGGAAVPPADGETQADYRAQFVTANRDGVEMSGYVDAHGDPVLWTERALVVRELVVIDPADIDVDLLANTIWSTSKADESTISAIGAEKVAVAVLNHLGLAKEEK